MQIRVVESNMPVHTFLEHRDLERQVNFSGICSLRTERENSNGRGLFDITGLITSSNYESKVDELILK